MKISQETKDFILNIAEGLLEEEGNVSARSIAYSVLINKNQSYKTPVEFDGLNLEQIWELIDSILSNANTTGRFKAKHNVHAISVYTKN